MAVDQRLGFAFAGAVFALLTLGYTSEARAFEPFASLLPCRATAVNDVGTERPCITCHDNPDGGSGCPMPMIMSCLNPFGLDFQANGTTWNATLAGMDSDGDGFTNGEELGDPAGTGSAFYGCGCVSRPGFMLYTPADSDDDGDGYCCRGQDNNSDGDCLDAGEDNATPPAADTTFDCGEGDDTVNSGLTTEVCTNTLDNDCDGNPTLTDPDCADVVDQDGDGYCPMGRDMNDDSDCIDAGENTGDVDCDDTQATVNPGAREYCRDGGLDNDCDGDADAADSECAPGTGDVDMDGDGYCPIGQDLSAPLDGDCTDAGEDTAEFDCDDGDMSVNSGATEICTDGGDNDCDGFVDFADSECTAFFDADGDGYCPNGRDGNGNGNCADAGETDDPGDCDDTEPLINPGMMENCLNGDVDDDCDIATTTDNPLYDNSLDDPDCAGYIDLDDDSFCFVGGDMDNDGTCIDDMEQLGNGDCDETMAAVNPSATEICTDGVDNNCNGTTDAADRFPCAEYRDVDHDGYCLVGRDMNDDGDCADAGEQGGPTEWDGDMDPHTDTGTEGIPTRYPGAPEHCFNMIDEDLDGLVDEADYCNRDSDADGDGWCPIGQDVNGDGDCLDDDENIRATDCNDSDPDISPGAMERCLELVDADCDSLVGTDDSDCFIYLDRDGDNFCGVGVDDNGDGDCLDLDEDRFGVDCDDRDTAINSGAVEICDDGIDNDCDDAIDQDDGQCICAMDADCNDGDSCTTDSCGGDGVCVRTPDPTCGDAGMPDGGMGEPVDDCNCRAVGTGGSGEKKTLPLLLVGLALLIRRRRRRG